MGCSLDIAVSNNLKFSKDKAAPITGLAQLDSNDYNSRSSKRHIMHLPQYNKQIEESHVWYQKRR